MLDQASLKSKERSFRKDSDINRRHISNLISMLRKFKMIGAIFFSICAVFAFSSGASASSWKAKICDAMYIQNGPRLKTLCYMHYTTFRFEGPTGSGGSLHLIPSSGLMAIAHLNDPDGHFPRGH